MTRSWLEIDRDHSRLTAQMATVQEEIDGLVARTDLTEGQREHLERKRRQFNLKVLHTQMWLTTRL